MSDFEVQEREEQRRKQGLPSLIGVRGYQPPVSAREEADDEPSVPRSPHIVQSRRGIKSTSRTLHSMPKTRPKRRSGRAS
jgi:hypothetical protein